MAEGLVRVRQPSSDGGSEIIRVSGQHVEEYLATHPGAAALDDDWRLQAKAAAKPADAGKGQ